MDHVTVKELIELLKTEDPNALVYRLAYDDEMEVEIVSVSKCETENGVLIA